MPLLAQDRFAQNNNLAFDPNVPCILTVGIAKMSAYWTLLKPYYKFAVYISYKLQVMYKYIYIYIYIYIYKLHKILPRPPQPKIVERLWSTR
ncbi:hypothetical protein EON65_34345 [archaeon]|nr:MAG: hypothetical protein EON65_34345 [archaeon]